MRPAKGAYMTYTKKREYTCSGTLYKEKAGRIRQNLNLPVSYQKPLVI